MKYSSQPQALQPASRAYWQVCVKLPARIQQFFRSPTQWCQIWLLITAPVELLKNPHSWVSLYVYYCLGGCLSPPRGFLAPSHRDSNFPHLRKRSSSFLLSFLPFLYFSFKISNMKKTEPVADVLHTLSHTSTQQSFEISKIKDEEAIMEAEAQRC